MIVDEHAFDKCRDPSFDRNKDWLRCELAHALRNNKNIVPVLLAGVERFPEDLPNDIANVSRKNGPRHTMYYFDSFYSKLKSDFLESKPNRNDFIVKPFSDDKDVPLGMNDWDEPSTRLGKLIKNLFKEKQ